VSVEVKEGATGTVEVAVKGEKDVLRSKNEAVSMGVLGEEKPGQAVEIAACYVIRYRIWRVETVPLVAKVNQ
jgi:hypothetical protein